MTRTNGTELAGNAEKADGRAMGTRERGVVAAVLLLIVLLVTVDVLVDLGQGATSWHVGLEVVAGSIAAMGALYLLRGAARMRMRLARQAGDLSTYRAQAEVWQAQARKHVEGLAYSINAQLERWRLSAAEKEIAFLLLKGLSLKDIAELRGTSEKTVRAQSAAIYAKAGLAGRSELSAFFLEDLLVPTDVAMNSGQPHDHPA